MESEKLLVILKEHCLFKKYKEILFPLLDNNEVNSFFNEKLKLYYKKSLDDICTYKSFYNGDKEYTSLDFPNVDLKKSKNLLFNQDINIKIDFYLSNSASDLEPSNHVKYYTNCQFVFFIEHKSTKKMEEFKLYFSQYIIKQYQSSMLIPEFTDSEKVIHDSVIDIYSKDDEIKTIRLKNFIIEKEKKNLTKRDYDISKSYLNILSEQDYNEAIIYGGLTQEKVDLMLLMHDEEASAFKNYIKNYDKTFFESIVNESKLKNNNKL